MILIVEVLVQFGISYEKCDFERNKGDEDDDNNDDDDNDWFFTVVSVYFYLRQIQAVSHT